MPAAATPGQRRLQILRPRPQPGRRLRPRTQRRPAAVRAVRRQHRQALDRDRRPRRPAAVQRDLQRQHRLQRDRRPEPGPSTRCSSCCRRSSARATPPSSTSAPPSTTSTRWSKPRSRRPRTWRRSCAELRPVLLQGACRSSATSASPSPGPASRTTRRNCSRRCPPSSSAPREAFPHAEEGDRTDFQPNLNFLRAYTPDLFNGFGRVGQVTGYYDGNGHYARVSFSNLNLFNYDSGTRRARTDHAERTVRRVRLAEADPAALPGRGDPAGVSPCELMTPRLCVSLERSVSV